jgi:hypothetical protein
MTVALRSALASAEGVPSVAAETVRARALWLTLGAVALATFATQVRLGVYADPLWLMICCERWLEGQTAYVDFLENSPPPAILLYLPPVVVAKWLGVAREPVFVIYVFAIVAGCLYACARLLYGLWLAGSIGAPTLVGAAAALLLAPDYAFGQRDHLALALALPFLTVLALRAEGSPVSRSAAAIAGLAAGLVCAVRPHYALAFAPAAAYVAWRRGAPALFGFPELYAAASALGLAGAASFAAFPRYFDAMLPMTMTTYVADRVSFTSALLTPVAAVWAVLAAALLVRRTGGQKSSLADVAALASTGAAAAYFVQAKGFAYHGYFAVALMFVAVTIVAADDLRRPALWIFAPLANCAAMASAMGYMGGVPMRGDFLLAAAATLAIYAILVPARHKSRAVASFFASALSCGALGLALFAFHLNWRGAPDFEREVRAIGPHPKIALISAIGNLAHPLVSRVQGRWTQRVISLLLTDHVDRILGHSAPDAPSRRRLEALKKLDLEMFLADVEQGQPDAVIVEEAWAAEHFNDPRVATWLAGYRRTASVMATRSGAPDPLTLYTRPTMPAPPSRNGADG